MTFVVTDNCIKCKYMDCIEVCPVDCFYEGENMLVIHPDECIDCGVCEPECPADAISADTEPGLESWLKLNAEYAADLAERHDQARATRRRQGVRRRRQQAQAVFLTQSRSRRLSEAAISIGCWPLGQMSQANPPHVRALLDIGPVAARPISGLELKAQRPRIVVGDQLKAVLGSEMVE